MKTSVYRFSLDVNQSQSQVSISAGKGENGVRLIIRMTENGAPFEVEDGSYAVFSAVKPDGKPVINDCAIFGNDTVVYDFTEQTVAVEGITSCQILLFGPDRSLIASARFQIVVHETIWDKGIESAEEFNIVKKFVEDINTVNDRLDKNADDIAANAADIADINALLYGYREGEPAEGEAPGPVLASVKAVDQKVETNKTNITANAAAIAANAKSISKNAQNLTTLTSQVDNPDHGLSAVERKIDNFLYGVTDTARDQLSEVLGLISANEQAIKQFVSMGGAPVGSGTLVVPADQWSDTTPLSAFVKLPSGTIGNGSVMLITPANDNTRMTAERARLSINVDPPNGNYNDTVVLLRAETAYKPEADMEFAFVILQTTAETSLVTLIGVDAAGSPAPTSVDLSAFDPDENGKGYITETYGEGEDAPKKVTEVIYDEAGNIIKIGNTAINWGEEG